MKHKSVNKLLSLLLTVTLFFTLTSCDTHMSAEAEEGEFEANSSNISSPMSEEVIEDERESITVSSDKSPITEISSPSANTATSSIDDTEGTMINITIIVGDVPFTANFYDSEAAQNLIAKMPMTINMSDVNDNEKVYQLSENLSSTATEKPETIHAGEIMCWSGNNLVLFYDTFENSYGGYIRLGYIEDVSGLVSAVGSGNVSVTFSIDK